MTPFYHGLAESSDALSSFPARPAKVRVASSLDSDTLGAVTSVLDALNAEQAALTLVFFSPQHNTEVLTRVLDERTGPLGLAGTTAGEITNFGFQNGGLSGISFHGPEVRAAVRVVNQLSQLSLLPVVKLPHQLAKDIGCERLENLNSRKHAWLMFAEGSTGRDRLLTSFFAQAASHIQLVGANFADGLGQGHSRLVHHGRLYTDSAAVILLEYPRPFEVISHTHLQFSQLWCTATKVSKDGLILEEIDGQPAQTAYLELLGISPDTYELSLSYRHPFGYRFRGRPFACSILEILPQGAFLLGCPIQAGERLNVLNARNLVEKTRLALGAASERLLRRHSPVQASLLFSCAARFLEAEARGKSKALGDALSPFPAAGFNSYGEHHNTLSLNHALTGIVFG